MFMKLTNFFLLKKLKKELLEVIFLVYTRLLYYFSNIRSRKGSKN